MNRQSKVKVLTAVIVFVGSSIGCSSGLVKSFAAMKAIRGHLIQKYHDEVGVNIENSRLLTITFVNSGLNKQDSNARWERAEDAARFVSRNYEDIGSIQQIWIAFVESHSKFGVLHYTRAIEAYGFDRDGAALNRAPNGEDLRAPVVRYSETANQTDISITRIQLEGNMTKGVALVPHFEVAGDARQAGSKVSPPEYVVFDFASYSDQPVFTDNAPLQIDCDGQPALKGSARLMPTPATGSNETIAQFLQVRMSFKAFSRIAHSQNVVIVLGPKRFQLAPGDISALERMTSYVPKADASP